MIRELVVFLALTSAALAAVSIAALEPKPEKFKDEKGCYIKELDIVLPLQESAPSKNSCSQYLCRANDVLIEMCSVALVVPPCQMLEPDVTKPYPNCCHAIVCP